MARDFDGVTGSYLEVAGTPGVSGYPLTVSAWVYLAFDPTTNDRTILQIQDNTSSTDYFIRLDISDGFDTGETAGRFRIQNSSAAVGQNWINGLTQPAQGQWYHVAAVMPSQASADFVLYLNGVDDTGANADDGTISPTAPNSISVGREGDNSPDDVWLGRLAQIAVYSAELTVGEIKALAAGVSPNRVRPTSLEHFWPLFGRGSPEPDYGPTGLNLTVNGGVTQADHASVAPMFGFDNAVIVGVGAAGGPTAPTLAATATSWDATQLDITVPGDATSVRVYRSTTSPVTTADTLVADVAATGTAFDTGIAAATQHFYLAVSDDGSNTTEGTEQSATTFANDAAETWTSGDPITFPLVIPSGEKCTSVEVDLGKVIRATTGLARAVDFAITVDDEGAVEVGSDTVLDVSATDQGTQTSITLASEPAGPQTLTVTITPTIAA